VRYRIRPVLAWTLFGVQASSALLVVLAASLLFWALVPAAAGWHASVVLSGSMQPRIAPGDVVLASHSRTPPRVGQVIVFADPAHRGRTLVHRVVERRPDGTLTTRGDANRSADSTPVPPANVRGVARLRIPFVGLPAYWLSTGAWWLLLASLVVLVAGTRIAVNGPSGRLPHRGRHRQRRWRRPAPRVLTVGCVAASLLAMLAPPAAAVFTLTSTNPNNQFTASGTFPTYPAAVNADGPSFYHRADDAAGMVTAADASANSRTGTYATVAQPKTVWEFDENSGTGTADLATAGADPGTLAGSAAWTASGHAGSGISLNGSTATVNGSTASVDTSQDFTVAAWVYLTDAVNTDYNIAVSQNGTTVSGFFLGFRGDVRNWSFAMLPSDAIGTAAVSSYGGSVALNTWVQLTGVYTASSRQLQLFVNGVACTATTRSAAWNATGALVAGAGRYSGSQTYFWHGQLDDVRTYQRALSASEVSTLVAGTTGGPAAWYRFDENGGTTAGDSSGNGNRGTFTGSAGWAAGHSGSAFSVAVGQTGYVQTAVPALRTDQSFSVAAWVYLTDNSITRTAVSAPGSNVCAFILKYDNSGTWDFMLPQTDTLNPASDQINSVAAAALNTWVFLVGVYDATAQTANLYVNAAQQGAGKSKTLKWNSTVSTQIGRAKWNGSWVDQWAGRVDDVRLYPRALSGTDITALYNGANVGAMLMGQPGALQGAQQGQQASTAVAYAGLGNGYNPLQLANPTAFTVEGWFKATSGGDLFGFSQYQTGTPAGTDDRVVYLDSSGKVVFGVNPGSLVTAQSIASYTDGNWHYVAASLGAAGMKLYLDGTLSATNATTAAQNTTGYWRWAGANLSTWPNRPASDNFIGLLDEVAGYPIQLSDQQIAWHYHANH
jgi:signal peptidase I